MPKDKGRGKGWRNKGKGQQRVKSDSDHLSTSPSDEVGARKSTNEEASPYASENPSTSTLPPAEFTDSDNSLIAPPSSEASPTSLSTSFNLGGHFQLVSQTSFHNPLPGPSGDSNRGPSSVIEDILNIQDTFDIHHRSRKKNEWKTLRRSQKGSL